MAGNAYALNSITFDFCMSLFDLPFAQALAAITQS